MSERLHIDITADSRQAEQSLASFDEATRQTVSDLALLQAALLDVENALSGNKSATQEQRESLLAYVRELLQTPPLTVSVTPVVPEEPLEVPVQFVGPAEPDLGTIQNSFATQMQALSSYRDLGLDVSRQMQQVWQDYADNLARLYGTDSQEYQQALDYKKQADKLYFEEQKRRITQYSSLSSASYNAMTDGMMAMFNSMITIETRSNNVLEQGFVAMANSFVSQLELMIARWLAFQALKTAFTGTGLFGFAQGGLVGGVTTLATGGIVSGGGFSYSDSIPALLSNGEFVVNAAATGANLPLLASINSGNGGLEQKLDELIGVCAGIGKQKTVIVLDPTEVVNRADAVTVSLRADLGRRQRAEI